MFQRLRRVVTRSGSPYSGPVVPEVRVEPGKLDVFRSEKLPDAGPVPWLDRPDAHDLVTERLDSDQITSDQANHCRKWIDDGYLILEDFFTDDRLDQAWALYEEALEAAIVTPMADISGPDELPGRTLNPHFRLSAMEELLYDADMVAVVELLMGASPLPFQTISGHRASQQPLHSDTIHMTTYPSGFLVANWIAFEDIDAGSGPLAYLPGTHRLPVISASEAGITTEEFDEIGDAAYRAKYEPLIADVAAASGVEEQHFTAKRGDVLLWHSNLLHGGAKQNDAALSRKALVCHYFAEGCVCYHDLTGNLAWTHRVQDVRDYPI